MKLDRDDTIEVFEVYEWEALTETVPTTPPPAVRLLHRDGTYIRVKITGYPERGNPRGLGTIWRDRQSAERYNRAWGSPFTIEEGGH